ncbi:toll/interleukin-1 receptor-like protein [Rhodamnia argentea]|uniref:ADP-ribosyl cyclase/cyclic ADP-ribose hydrolase n=1 Tax=Rhodamnia argentea TaxID=178133 RepID=A0ABM3HII3_9MYRT|nr:toll/interleukin-1 receptor-like protein [Rhodamnia argentea]
MHRLVSGRSLAVLIAPILLSVLVFYRLKKKKGKSAEKESTEGPSSAPSLISPIPTATGGGNERSAEKECTDGPSSAPSLISPIPTATGGGSDQYDVFLSCRGSDTRFGFADYLYTSLINVGISVFMGTKSITAGEEIGPRIFDAITRSKILIPIISENYAWSTWCLLELIRIMDCKGSMSRIVLPIFYRVKPSDVRNLRGNFGQAFNSRKHRLHDELIQEGEQALRDVTDLNGWEARADGYFFST